MTTPQIEFNVAPVAECSVLITLALPPSTDQIRARYAQCMAHFSDTIRQNLVPVLMNVTPAYNTILVDYLPYRISEHQLIEQINILLNDALSSLSSVSNTCKTVELPAYYSPETALDLYRYQAKGLSLEEIIQHHTSQTYIVSAIGFTPGFAFLSDVVNRLALPRHSTPRLCVPKGSIGIADTKTSVYPSDSPGGWNIIGNCPLPLFDHNQLKSVDVAQRPLSLLNVGDCVRFIAISKQEFLELRSMEVCGGATD